MNANENDNFDLVLSFEDLSDEEKDVILRRYGMQPGLTNRDTDRLTSFDALVKGSVDFSTRGGGAYYAHPVVGIKTLSRSEAWFFAAQGFVSAQFCVQYLYKVDGNFSRTEFRNAVYKLMAKTPELCVNFCPTPKRVLKIITKGVLPDIDYRNIERMASESTERTVANIMKKETERGFDLSRGALLRLQVVRTGNAEYAVILTQSYLINEAWDPRKFFLTAFAESGTVKERLSLEKLLAAQDLENAVSPGVFLQDAMSDTYWRTLLKDLPAAPYITGWRQVTRNKAEQKIYRKEFSGELMRLLASRTNRQKGLFIAVLQLAWGLFLHGENHIKDAAFAAVMPLPHARAINASQTAGIVNPVIVRVHTGNTDKKVKDIVAEHFRQVLASQTFVSVYFKDLLKSLAIDEKMFAHFLSFHGFMTDSRLYHDAKAAPQGTSVAVDTWDAGGVDLGVYFRFVAENIIVTLRYNNAAFAYTDIDDIFHRYEKLLHILLIDWDLSLGDFWDHFAGELNYVRRKNISNIRAEKAAAFFRELPLFKNVSPKEINNLAAATETFTAVRNDELPPAEGNLLFVSWGALNRHLEFKDGTRKKIDVAKGKMWLNETSVFADPYANINIDIEKSPVTVIALPLPVLEENPDLMARFKEYAELLLNKYDKRILGGAAEATAAPPAKGKKPPKKEGKKAATKILSKQFTEKTDGDAS